jgi:HK97 gp10 family phage protein
MTYPSKVYLVDVKTNLPQVIKQFNMAADKIDEVAAKALKKAAILVEKRARSYFKTGGPGGGWRGLEESTKRVKSAMGKGGKGILVRSTSLLHSITTQEKGNSIQVGTSKIQGKMHEFGFRHSGTTNVEPRSFLGPALEEEEENMEQVFIETLEEEMDL